MSVPLSVHNRAVAGMLEIEWPGQGTRRLSHGQLRAACPCSDCRAARLKGGIALIAAGVTVQAVLPQGYGVQLVFSDGHDRGIYPWAYLHAL